MFSILGCLRMRTRLPVAPLCAVVLMNPVMIRCAFQRLRHLHNYANFSVFFCVGHSSLE